MTFSVAVAGKGGTGKTTLAALLIRYIRETTGKPILAIDADPSSNLNQALGMPLENTVGDVREEMAVRVSRGAMEPGVSKQDYLEYQIEQALVEGEGIDLLAMGRPEGPGCYCAANNMLRLCVDRIASSYDYLFIDNEAGLEHLSRRTTQDVDSLVVVSDPTMRGLTAAARVLGLVDELKTKVGRRFLVVNRVNGNLPPQLSAAIADLKVELVATVPVDPGVADLDAMGEPLVGIPADSPIYGAVKEIGRRLLDR
ncbi:MAG: AAA family ATPase [Dehalococcoidales bacterium]|nr:AAA family ATPase [Dehalococcoidales bacterium]